MSQLMLKKEDQGNVEAVKFIQRLSPVASQHINFNGYYQFSLGPADFVEIEKIISHLDTVIGKSDGFNPAIFEKPKKLK